LTQPHDKENYACILAAVDFELDMPDAPDDLEQKLNQKIVDVSGALALSDFAGLNFVHVWDAPGEMMVRSWASKPNEAADAYVDGQRSRHGDALDRFRGQVKDRLGGVAYDHLLPRFHILRGAASKVIPETARRLQADLVVMGTVARTGIVGVVIGNTAESILSQLHCSVLALKPDGFVSPVKLSD
jgi:nucleotide-binding universal stress UspA family protein